MSSYELRLALKAAGTELDPVELVPFSPQGLALALGDLRWLPKARKDAGGVPSEKVWRAPIMSELQGPSRVALIRSSLHDSWA